MKKTKALGAIILLLSLVIVGCNGETSFEEPKLEALDYSEFEFTDVVWTRTTEHDVENIIFFSDGRFTYYCGCGNPVNDADLCEGYIYNDETKEIDLMYMEEAEESISKIKINYCDETTIEMSFDGETRAFSKEKEI